MSERVSSICMAALIAGLIVNIIVTVMLLVHAGVVCD